MKKPSAVALKLYHFGSIEQIRIFSRLTGNDTSVTLCVMASGPNKLSGKWSTYEDYVDLRPNWNSLARLKHEYREECKAWMEYEAKNKDELDEYSRLKAKYS